MAEKTISRSFSPRTGPSLHLVESARRSGYETMSSRHVSTQAYGCGAVTDVLGLHCHTTFPPQTAKPRPGFAPNRETRIFARRNANLRANSAALRLRLITRQA